MKTHLILWGLFLGCIILMGVLFVAGVLEEQKEVLGPNGGLTPSISQVEHKSVLPYGSVALALHQQGTFESITIEPVTIVQDSRCPVDVVCIQAGTVEVEVVIDSGMGTSTSILALNEFVTTESHQVTLVKAAPDHISSSPLEPEQYVFTFEVVQANAHEPEPLAPAKASLPAKSCYVGGCSSQLCTDTPGAVSTCEYRESYACYASATCEVQANGDCGWTQTAQLQACVLDAHNGGVRM